MFCVENLPPLSLGEVKFSPFTVLGRFFFPFIFSFILLYIHAIGGCIFFLPTSFHPLPPTLGKGDIWGVSRFWILFPSVCRTWARLSLPGWCPWRPWSRLLWITTSRSRSPFPTSATRTATHSTWTSLWPSSRRTRPLLAQVSRPFSFYDMQIIVRYYTRKGKMCRLYTVECYKNTRYQVRVWPSGYPAV